MDESATGQIEHFVKSTPDGLLILRANRAEPGSLRQYFIPATALGSFDVSDPDVTGQARHCLVCGGGGQCPACEGTGLNQFGLPCLWCTPGILVRAKESGQCSLCRGTGLPRDESPAPTVFPDAVDPGLA